MHRLLRALLTLVLLASVAGLGHADDKTPSTPFFPLVPGSVWHYRAGEARFQVKVGEIKTVGSTQRAELKLVVNNKTISYETVGVNKDGVVRFTFEKKEAKPPIEFLRLPFKAGTKWNVDSKVDGQNLKGTFLMTETTVTVPAGTYKNALSVAGKDLRANEVPISLTYYFAENVGMVKQEIDMAGQKIEIVLEKYEPGKK